MRRNPRKTRWTVLYRRKHKKGTVEEVNKKRTRKTVKFQRAIQGATLESILQKRNQKPEVRKAQREQAIRLVGIVRSISEVVEALSLVVSRSPVIHTCKSSFLVGAFIRVMTIVGNRYTIFSGCYLQNPSLLWLLLILVECINGALMIYV